MRCEDCPCFNVLPLHEATGGYAKWQKSHVEKHGRWGECLLHAKDTRGKDENDCDKFLKLYTKELKDRLMWAETLKKFLKMESK